MPHFVRAGGEGWLAEPQLATTSPLSSMGFGKGAFSRFASEGWSG